MEFYNLEKCKEIASLKGGRCLSEDYKNPETQMIWECCEKHTWISPFRNIKYWNSWCPICSGSNKHTIEECKTFAATKSGKCLSQEYKGNKSKLEWECEKGHTWLSSFNNIEQGAWCPICSGNIKNNILQCKSLAISKEGQCLSEEYINSFGLLLWKCKEGHEWKASLNNVKNNDSWCPSCKKNYKTEKKVRKILEKLTGFTFPSKWFVVEGRRFEIDCYCEELKLGFEYDGEQHYIAIDHWNGEEGLIKQKQRDLYKNEVCQQLGINLIRISFKDKDVLEQKITKELNTIHKILI